MRFLDEPPQPLKPHLAHPLGRTANASGKERERSSHPQGNTDTWHLRQVVGDPRFLLPMSERDRKDLRLFRVHPLNQIHRHVPAPVRTKRNPSPTLGDEPRVGEPCSCLARRVPRLPFPPAQEHHGQTACIRFSHQHVQGFDTRKSFDRTPKTERRRPSHTNPVRDHDRLVDRCAESRIMAGLKRHFGVQRDHLGRTVAIKRSQHVARRVIRGNP
ncbi:hypothetical protein A2856_02215 [Candidatus Uhrbacteria bacterium RIFCSPHIGHO2_01_FULL_63_20]|uniref:Uncharacterized protein n=1 Tax=Candidatus Uhrbacteria bacterium RIFCSPHIGHO2_01_FULL_63_20 TaxID=1802385 RepID=A0A1F7TLR3_9BACT|nr:MAG: hypothetical protein A2856_02215 [Candidatus Uhrbacteria bacterium RIFCSPHIGHO2_01_FULL_63_20]